jgi:hypothetical protein
MVTRSGSWFGDSDAYVLLLQIAVVAECMAVLVERPAATDDLGIAESKPFSIRASFTD